MFALTMPSLALAWRPLAVAVLGTGTLAACAVLPASDDTVGTTATAAVPQATLPPAPPLRLAPAALGGTLAVQQRITVTYRDAEGEQSRELLALLQADADSTRLAAVASGQVLARLVWDGTRLEAWRSPWAPPELDPARILDELQLAVWPLPEIAAALPAGWHIDATASGRRLRWGTQAVIDIAYPDAATTVLRQLRDGYRLTIVTLPAQEGTP